jgi:hypothetical protein
VCSTDPTFKRSLTHDEWKDFFTDDEEKSYGYASDEDSAMLSERMSGYCVARSGYVNR